MILLLFSMILDALFGEFKQAIAQQLVFDRSAEIDGASLRVEIDYEPYLGRQFYDFAHEFTPGGGGGSGASGQMIIIGHSLNGFGA